MSESAATISAKATAEALHKKQMALEMYKAHLSKFVFKDENQTSPNYPRAQEILNLLRPHLLALDTQILAQDAILFACQMNDIEDELNGVATDSMVDTNPQA